MKKWYNKLFLNNIRKAVDNFSLIQNGDKILVGLSGGKDSIFLLYSLNLLKNRSYLDFDILGAHIDLNLGVNVTPIKDFCNELNIPFIVEKTDIGQRIFNSDKSPCYLCSKLKRGAISRIAKKYNCNKIAFGHHLTDVVETFLLNLIYTGKIGTFKPNTYNTKKDLTLIRPLIYVNEETIEKVVKMESLPLAKGSKCPMDKQTKREEMKTLVKNLKNLYPDFEEKVISGIQNIDLDKLWIKR
ncbi:tRNA lysidine(34) synthetase [Thermohalobacter berrensis]|uniref:tRNA 2-thiocytidine(32) synthetase TtcA n=1 Tax=Thermohalobacter berrensis TaxID=99594 RepID=A0A419SV33_9FIRM|nr:ATP-binding protein [Thermohalobacter berrensis]RKD29073.1 tRNA 2-thiocytidine(32) synthetase TtcA [Thermohalobacter berrensis]